MKKLLLLLTGILMSCSVYAQTFSTAHFTTSLLPTDEPILIKYAGKQMGPFFCHFQTGGDNIPITISGINAKPLDQGDGPYDKLGSYTIHYPGITRFHLSLTGIMQTEQPSVLIQNNDYTPTSREHSTLIIKCGEP